MKSYTWVVLTNCRPGSEAQFNAWYDTVHVGDLLRVPGIVSASRSRLTAVQMVATADGELDLAGSIDPAYRFLAIYKLRTDDLEGVLQEILRRSNTPEMYVSEDMIEAVTMLYEDL